LKAYLDEMTFRFLSLALVIDMGIAIFGHNADMENTATEEDLWSLLQDGNCERALSLLKEKNARNPSVRTNLAYGSALMWSGMYQDAADHFSHAIEASKSTKKPWMRGEPDYVLLGAANWCSGDYSRAIDNWRGGTNPPYANFGVALQTPMLMVVASILRPAICTKSEPIGILHRKLAEPRVFSWLGSLARFAAGKIDSETLRHSTEQDIQQAVSRRAPDQGRTAHWLISFYEAVLHLEKGKTTAAEFHGLMQSMTRKADLEPFAANGFWLLATRGEFYIARHEASKS
jgi:hypothetical protein